MLGPSAHVDTFARDNLPKENLLPDFNLGSFRYPEKLNAGYELTDALVKKVLAIARHLSEMSVREHTKN